MRVSRAHPSIEGSRRLWLPLFSGVDVCLEEVLAQISTLQSELINLL
jgi:hypothetical protein